MWDGLFCLHVFSILLAATQVEGNLSRPTKHGSGLLQDPDGSVHQERKARHGCQGALLSWESRALRPALRTLWDFKLSPYYRGFLNSTAFNTLKYYTGVQNSVLIIGVSAFQKFVIETSITYILY